MVPVRCGICELLMLTLQESLVDMHEHSRTIKPSETCAVNFAWFDNIMGRLDHKSVQGLPCASALPVWVMPAYKWQVLLSQVMYDPKQTDYKQLLNVFLENHDPTSLNKQGGDAGTQYRSGLYFHTEEQRQVAEEVMAEAAPSYEVNPSLE